MRHTVKHALHLLQGVVDPLPVVPWAVEERRWGVALLLASLLAASSGAMRAMRVDASSAIIASKQDSGQTRNRTEARMQQAIRRAQRLAVVRAVADGIVGMPLRAFGMAGALQLAGWFLRRQGKFGAYFTAAAFALLPVALFHLIQFGAVLRQPYLSAQAAKVLVPTSLSIFHMDASPSVQRLFGCVDVINLWSALLLGLGFAGATRWVPWRGALVGLVLYALFAGAYSIGLAGLLASGR